MGRGLYYPGENAHAWHVDNDVYSWAEDQHGTPYPFPVFDCDLFADEMNAIKAELTSLFPSLYSVNRWTRRDENIILENKQIEIGWTSDEIFSSIFIRTRDGELWPDELPLAMHNMEVFAVKIEKLLLSYYPGNVYTGSGYCASKLSA